MKSICKLSAVLVLTLIVGQGLAHAQTAPVTPQEKAAVRSVIQALYDAYKAHDVGKVLALEHVCIENSARDFEQRGKGSAQDVRDAFRGETEDLLKSRGFALKPLNLHYAEYRREGDTLVVSSVMPIISMTQAVEIVEGGHSHMNRLQIAKFKFQKTATGYDIVFMFKT